MSLYRCPKCGCVENTALGDYWGAQYEKREPQCSECATGSWHGQFPKRSAVGMLIDQDGHLWSKEQAESSYFPKHYRIVGEVTE